MKRLSILVKSLFASSLLLTLFGGAAAAQHHTRIASWIEKQTQTPNLAFTAWFKNDSSQTIKNLSYQFNGWKKSQAGTSQISQSGKFKAKAGKTKSLSTIQWGEEQEAEITLKLEIFHQNELIATDSMKLKP
jgi:hypothetical protein